MKGYIIRRIVGLIPVLFIASIFIFLIIHFIPGDPVYTLLPPDPAPEQIEAVREAYGFDKSLFQQYGIWLGRVLRGNFGISISSQWDVGYLLRTKFGVTIQLAIMSFLISVIIALPLGLQSGLYPESFMGKRFLNFYTAFGLAMPSFWLGILLIILFSVTLRWLPTSGFVSFFENPVRAFRHLRLPAFTQGLPASVVYANFISASVREVMGKEYVTAAIAKGTPRRIVVFRHILRNALIPVVTVSAINFGRLVAGGVITESVFSIPGLGRLLVEAIGARDYALLQANLLLLVVIFMSANFIADLINAWLDPRIRYS